MFLRLTVFIALFAASVTQADDLVMKLRLLDEIRNTSAVFRGALPAEAPNVSWYAGHIPLFAKGVKGAPVALDYGSNLYPEYENLSEIYRKGMFEKIYSGLRALEISGTEFELIIPVSVMTERFTEVVYWHPEMIPTSRVNIRIGGGQVNLNDFFRREEQQVRADVLRLKAMFDDTPFRVTCQSFMSFSKCVEGVENLGNAIQKNPDLKRDLNVTFPLGYRTLIIPGSGRINSDELGRLAPLWINRNSTERQMAVFLRKLIDLNLYSVMKDLIRQKVSTHCESLDENISSCVALAQELLNQLNASKISVNEHMDISLTIRTANAPLLEEHTLDYGHRHFLLSLNPNAQYDALNQEQIGKLVRRIQGM